MMIVRTMGTVLAAVALFLGGAVVAAGTAYADAGTRCQGEMLESVPITDAISGAPVGRVQRFREPLTRSNCAETYASIGAGAAITTFVVVDGRTQVVRGGSVGLRWPAQRGCVVLGGTVNEHKGSARACG